MGMRWWNKRTRKELIRENTGRRAGLTRLPIQEFGPFRRNQHQYRLNERPNQDSMRRKQTAASFVCFLFVFICPHSFLFSIALVLCWSNKVHKITLYCPITWTFIHISCSNNHQTYKTNSITTSRNICSKSTALCNEYQASSSNSTTCKCFTYLYFSWHFNYLNSSIKLSFLIFPALYCKWQSALNDLYSIN